MSDLKTLRGILKNLERVEDDIAALSDSTNKVVIDGHAITGDNAKLIIAAGVNVLSSRRDNLIERLKTEYNVDIEC